MVLRDPDEWDAHDYRVAAALDQALREQAEERDAHDPEAVHLVYHNGPTVLCFYPEASKRTHDPAKATCRRCLDVHQAEADIDSLREAHEIYDDAERADVEAREAEERESILESEHDRYLRNLSTDEIATELDDYEENQREIRAETMPDYSNQS